MNAESAFPILYAKDVESLSSFYEAGLGFERAFRWPPKAALEYVYLRLGPLGIGITEYTVAERLHGAPAAAGGPSRFELCVYVDDADAAAERLISLGAKPLAPPREMPWGERLAYVSDPEGNPVHLTMRLA